MISRRPRPSAQSCEPGCGRNALVAIRASRYGKDVGLTSPTFCAAWLRLTPPHPVSRGLRRRCLPTEMPASWYSDREALRPQTNWAGVSPPLAPGFRAAGRASSSPCLLAGKVARWPEGRPENGQWGDNAPRRRFCVACMAGFPLCRSRANVLWIGQLPCRLES